MVYRRTVMTCATVSSQPHAVAVIRSAWIVGVEPTRMHRSMISRSATKSEQTVQSEDPVRRFQIVKSIRISAHVRGGRISLHMQRVMRWLLLLLFHHKRLHWFCGSDCNARRRVTATLCARWTLVTFRNPNDWLRAAVEQATGR